MMSYQEIWWVEILYKVFFFFFRFCAMGWTKNISAEKQCDKIIKKLIKTKSKKYIQEKVSS